MRARSDALDARRSGRRSERRWSSMLETGAGRTTAGCRLTGAGSSMSSSNSSSKSACSTRPRYSPTFRIAPAMRTPCVRSEMTLLRLPRRWTLTEYRTPDAKVCRAGGDRDLEVAAHPRGDDRGVRMVLADLLREAHEV